MGHAPRWPPQRATRLDDSYRFEPQRAAVPTRPDLARPHLVILFAFAIILSNGVVFVGSTASRPALYRPDVWWLPCLAFSDGAGHPLELEAAPRRTASRRAAPRHTALCRLATLPLQRTAAGQPTKRATQFCNAGNHTDNTKVKPTPPLAHLAARGGGGGGALPVRTREGSL